ncbi:MAG: DUF4397 domain-containing protein [Woeseiaceae bacterium]|nr:DUF4397 domain-containing protein [Woeseiaceae bacterium]
MRNLLLLGLLAALVGCSSESNFPTPTGKGTVRAINAIPQSPTVTFLIEQRALGNLAYGAATAGQRWDDFEYTFNFRVNILGEDDPRVIASQLLKVDADRDYTFLLTGDTLTPTVTLFESDERSYDGTESIFQVQFIHAAPAEGPLDAFLAPPGTPLVAGEELATLNFGEVSAPIDLTAEDLVLTYTVAGDPTQIVFQSDTTSIVSSQSVYAMIIPATENLTAPYLGRLINLAGGDANLVDIRIPPTIRFIQAAITLPTADVYDDEMLTNQILSDFAFGDVSGDLVTTTDQVDYTYTDAGNPGAILFEAGFTAFAGRRHNFYSLETLSGLGPLGQIVERSTVATAGRARIFPAANNHQSLDLYVVDAGEPLTDETPLFTTLIYTLASPVLNFTAGSYDIYVTAEDDRSTIVAGPVQMDLALGEFQEIVIFDTVDPATAEIRLLPTP